MKKHKFQIHQHDSGIFIYRVLFPISIITIFIFASFSESDTNNVNCDKPVLQELDAMKFQVVKKSDGHFANYSFTVKSNFILKNSNNHSFSSIKQHQVNHARQIPKLDFPLSILSFFRIPNLLIR
ncbi:MAG: hypothetical protein U9R19_12480 [Bacteroidota bacterium]|nr:hypothetical protein [Bacteroidota bacterium]